MAELLAARSLVKHFPVEGSRDVVHAVDGVDLAIEKGETLGLVGESGCGKSTLGRVLLRLLEPTAGAILFDGQDLARTPAAQMRRLRARMQIIFQDPFSSLNPRMSVSTLLERPLVIHTKMSRAERQARIEELLQAVGLRVEHRGRYPHEFSGGQRQRIAIARALAAGPQFVVLDEPTSALDVSVQAQILNLLKKLQQEQDLTYLFISHDLSAISHMSDRIAVMYLGKVVELTSRENIFRNPQHPYTKALMSAIPIPNPKLRRERIRVTGDVPSAIKVPKGCRFHTRCPFAEEICRQLEPPLIDVAPGGGPRQLVACHLVKPAHQGGPAS